MGPELEGMGLLRGLLPLFVRTSSMLYSLRSDMLIFAWTGLRRYAPSNVESYAELNLERD